MAGVEYVELDAETADLFNKMLLAKSKAKRAYAEEKKARNCKAAVIAAMGEVMFAKLPDGRVIQRVPRSRDMPAKPKHTQRWEDLNVAIIPDDQDPVVALAGV